MGGIGSGWGEVISKACKIRDIAADRYLPTEAVTSELPTLQMLPKMASGMRGLISQGAAAALGNRITHASDYPTFCPLPTLPSTTCKGGSRDACRSEMRGCATTSCVI